MAKKSRRQRRLLAEKEERRIKALAKAEKQYSKHEERICRHYYVQKEYRISAALNIPAKVGSHLKKLDKNKFVCTNCGKIFTAEQADKINTICTYLENIITKKLHLKPKETLTKLQSELAALFTEDIAPCRYYLIGPNEPFICGTEKIEVPKIIELMFNPLIYVM